MKARIEVIELPHNRWEWKMQVMTPNGYLYIDAGGITSGTEESAREAAEKAAKMLGLEIVE